MRRPLQELPLELFLPPNPNLPGNATSFKSRPNKRPFSPSQSSLFSPTKRRLLHDEGISEKVLKSTLSTSRGRVSPAKFADALRGPNSPAKRLDFGVPKDYIEGSRSSSSSASSSSRMTLPEPTSSATLAFSSESKSKSKSKSSVFTSIPSLLYDGEDIDDYFSSPRLLAEIPPLPNPQSTHYPGFIVHHDTHIVLECARSASVEPETSMSDSCSDTDADQDWEKENNMPRRRALKSSALPSTSDLKPVSLLKDMESHGKTWSTPATPKKNASYVCALECPMTPTPRRPSSGGGLMFPSPGITPVVRQRERLERKKVLEVEVDDVIGEGEDDEGVF